MNLQHHLPNYNVGAKLQWLCNVAFKFRSPAIPFINVILLIITSGCNRPTNPGDVPQHLYSQHLANAACIQRTDPHTYYQIPPHVTVPQHVIRAETHPLVDALSSKI
jgi:hypothetical protein